MKTKNFYSAFRPKYNFFRNCLAVIFVGIFLFYNGCTNDDAANKGGGFSMPPLPVEAAQVKEQKVEDRFESIGTVEALESITVVSEIDGEVTGLPFEEGSFIKKGDLIAQLDDAQLAAEVRRSEALRDQSRAKYDRVKSIVDQNAGTLQDLDNAAAELKVAEANLSLAKTRFIKTHIVAPFDGNIGARKISVGTFLRAGQPIAELANIDEIRVNFSAPERFLAKLTKGAEVNVSTTAYPGYEVKGKIIVIEPVLDPSTRNARIVARIPNHNHKFLPGMSANVSAVLSEHLNAATIPNESIFANGSQSFVYVVKPDSTVTLTPVTLGLQLADVVEITDGLQIGQIVVQAGHQKLTDGAKVIPIFDMKTAVK